MRVPNDRPSAVEVARDIARDFGFGESDIPTIERSLLSFDRILQDIEQFPTITEIKKDFADLHEHVGRLHEHAGWLHEKNKDIPAPAYPLRSLVNPLWKLAQR